MSQLIKTFCKDNKFSSILYNTIKNLWKINKKKVWHLPSVPRPRIELGSNL